MRKTAWFSGVLIVTTLVSASAQRPALRSGFDTSRFDASVRPQDNLYRYVNGAWLDDAVIPDDRVSHTAATELVEKTNLDLRTIVEELSATSGRRRNGSAEQQVADLYRSMLDEAAIEARGIEPLLPQLRAIDNIDSIRTLAEVAGRLSATTTAGPFFGSVGLDPRLPGEPVVHLSQGGLLLERDLYLSDDDAARRTREEYGRYLERIFRLVGRADPAADADAVLALEADLARAHRSTTDGLPAEEPTPPLSLSQMTSAFPGFDWPAWARPQGIDRVRGVIVLQSSFFRTFSAMAQTRPLGTWRAWLAGRYVTALAPYVSQPVSDARFDFFGTFLTGQKTPIPRWKRGVSLVNATLGHAIGRLYVERHFSRASRTRVERIVQFVVRAYRESIERLDWMSGAARSEARNKLTRLRARVGYPDSWRDYRGLEIRPDDLFGNLARAQAFDNARRMARVESRDTRGDWPTTPQTVNAYYVPSQNEIILPAAMLQPPYFDPAADEAVNYGSIGAVIGHEIGHGLDDTGRWYDATGSLRNWWSEADEAAYRGRATPLFEQLAQYPAPEGLRLNAALTIAESLGDLAGLSAAYRAYRMSLDGRPPPVIDGLSGDQRFFLGWARIWRTKERPEYRRQLFLASRYAPAEYRSNGTAGHVDAFYAAFGVGLADALFVPPSRRAHIF